MKKTEKGTFIRTASGLVRSYGTFDAILIGTFPTWGLLWAVVEFPWFYGFFPGANLPLCLLIITPPFILYGIIYWVLGVSMPRAGADYMWVSRTVGPMLGFAWSLLWFFALFAAYTTSLIMFVYLIATSLQIPGMLFNVGPLAGLGPALSTTNATFALAVLITVIFMVFTVLGSRAIRTLFYVAWAAEVVGIVVMWGLLATTSPDVFAKAWDASFLGQALPHGQVISTAITNGYKVVPDFSWEITLASLPLGPLFFFGYYYSTIVAGEVKDIRKSIPISIFGVFALTYVWWAVSATLNLKALGAQWFYALSYLWEITPNAWSSLGLPTPTMNLMLSLMAFPNMWLVALISITFILASTPMVYLFFFLQTRYFFAWGFDRVVPTRLAEVNRRYRTPVNATIALGILTVLLLFLYLYTGWSTLYTMMVFQQTLTFIGPSIAAIVFPFVLKSLFESLPPVLRARVGRVPLISVVGVVCAVFFAYLSYVFYATPQIAVPSMWGIAFLIATFVFAIALYLGSRAYWRSKGVAIDLAFKELPPD